jgi:hypothetical protein
LPKDHFLVRARVSLPWKRFTAKLLKYYTHLTPICSSSERKSGLNGFIHEFRVKSMKLH